MFDTPNINYSRAAGRRSSSPRELSGSLPTHLGALTALTPRAGNMEGWGSLQPPSLRDIRGRGGATKGLSAPPPPLTHLVVLDFEWTADDRRKMEPCSEITQFPSVLVRLDGHASAAIDEFDMFVRPEYNPQLTPFAVGLTAITQADVDAAPTLAEALPRYLEWLRGHGLVDAAGRRLGSWCVCTWSDADIGGQLSTEVPDRRSKGAK